jgi:hypothetical protein
MYALAEEVFFGGKAGGAVPLGGENAVDCQHTAVDGIDV